MIVRIHLYAAAIVCLHLSACRLAPPGAQEPIRDTPKPVPKRPAWTWRSPSPQGNDLLGVWHDKKRDLYAVGAAGTILHSADGGKTWSREDSGVKLTLHDIWGDGAGALYAVGEEGAVLSSRDAGKTWSRATLGKERLVSVLGDGGALYAMDDNGAVYRSDDAGKTWVGAAPKIPFAGFKNDLFVSKGDLIIAAHAGIFRFAGGVWSEMSPGKGKSEYWAPRLFSVSGDGAGNLYAVGESGAFYSSADNGATWRRAKSGTEASLEEVWVSAGGEVYAVGSGVVLSSKDKGGSFQLADTGSADVLCAVSGGGPGELFAAGLGGAFFASYDGGRTFRALSRRSIDARQSLGFFWEEGERLFVAGHGEGGEEGAIWVSTDGGETFLRWASFAGGNALWATPEGDAIFLAGGGISRGIDWDSGKIFGHNRLYQALYRRRKDLAGDPCPRAGVAALRDLGQRRGRGLRRRPRGDALPLYRRRRDLEERKERRHNRPLRDLGQRRGRGLCRRQRRRDPALGRRRDLGVAALARPPRRRHLAPCGLGAGRRALRGRRQGHDDRGRRQLRRPAPTLHGSGKNLAGAAAACLGGDRLDPG
jgi:photosystem II stability/assembly factor-like uncharacterized protein